MKRCTCCEQEKPTSEFGKCSKLPDGLNIYCRDCNRAKSQEWRAANRERNNESQRNRYHADTEKSRTYKREEARRNREQRKAYAVKRRAENYDRVLEIERASRTRNKEKNRPAKNARQQIRNRKVQGATHIIAAKDLRRLYSQPCAECGTMQNLSIDHIIPLSRGGSHSVGNMMTLCRSCNASKNARTIMEWRQAKTLIAV